MSVWQNLGARSSSPCSFQKKNRDTTFNHLFIIMFEYYTN